MVGACMPGCVSGGLYMAGVHGGGMHGRGGHGKRCLCWGACMQWGIHTGEAATEAGATHPTGMHSCCDMCLVDLD